MLTKTIRICGICAEKADVPYYRSTAVNTLRGLHERETVPSPILKLMSHWTKKSPCNRDPSSAPHHRSLLYHLQRQSRESSFPLIAQVLLMACVAG